MRKVDLRLKLFGCRTRAAAGSSTRLTVLAVVFLDALRLIHFDGAGVRLLFRDSNFWEDLEYYFCFDLEFSRQVIDSYLLLHSARFLRDLPYAYAFIASSRMFVPTIEIKTSNSHSVPFQARKSPLVRLNRIAELDHRFCSISCCIRSSLSFWFASNRRVLL